MNNNTDAVEKAIHIYPEIAKCQTLDQALHRQSLTYPHEDWRGYIPQSGTVKWAAGRVTPQSTFNWLTN